MTLADYLELDPRPTDTDIGKALGISRHAVRRYRLKMRHVPVGERSDFATPLSASPTTLDDLFRLFALNPDEWDVIECTPNVYQMGAKHPETGELLAQPLYQLKARLRPKAGKALADLKAQLLEDIRADTKLRTRVHHKAKAIPESDLHAAELDIFDLHLGKLGHVEEVGANYDSKIAMECAQDAVRDLLWQAKPYPIEEIILPLGNDFFNSDNLVGTTTGGTRQDTDTRYHLMFRRGRALASWMIHECAKVAPVRVIIVPGNHDQQTMFDLGEVMDAEFALDPRVTINNTAAPRKYHVYGKNLLGFCHGNDEKPADLPELMATEQPVLWGQSVYREFHIGHFHHGKEKAPLIVDDKRSVTVRWIRSLSGADRWHIGKGYLGRRGAEGFVYSKTGGLRAHLFTYPEVLAA